MATTEGIAFSATSDTSRLPFVSEDFVSSVSSLSLFDFLSDFIRVRFSELSVAACTDCAPEK